MRHLGVEWAMQSDAVRRKSEETCMKKYNVKNVMQVPEVFERARRTTNNRYGVDHYAQSIEFHKKCHKPFTSPKYSDMAFTNSWEFKVYDFLTENHIEFEYQPAISIPYEYKGTYHTYHPDFLVNGSVYEVKGDQFFRINESTGKEEMFCPYKGELSDEEYAWHCGLVEAKHQCILKNNVRILRGADVNNLDQTFKDVCQTSL